MVDEWCLCMFIIADAIEDRFLIVLWIIMKIDDYPFNQWSLTWIIIEDTHDKNQSWLMNDEYGWYMLILPFLTSYIENYGWWMMIEDYWSLLMSIIEDYLLLLMTVDAWFSDDWIQMTIDNHWGLLTTVGESWCLMLDDWCMYTCTWYMRPFCLVYQEHRRCDSVADRIVPLTVVKNSKTNAILIWNMVPMSQSCGNSQQKNTLSFGGV